MHLKDSEKRLFREINVALQSSGIGVFPKTHEILKAYGRDTLAVDDAILIVSSPDLRGWSSSAQIEIVYDASDKRLLELPPFEQLATKHDGIRKPQRNEPKITILNWNKYCRNDECVLRLNLGQSSMEENIIIEFMANHTILKISETTECTLYDAYRHKFLDFWTHLPNLTTVTPVIITSDDKVIVSRRSSEVYYYPNHWEISISEQINPTEQLDRESPFFGAIKRGIQEELGSAEILEVKILGIYREVSSFNVNIAALVRVTAREKEMQKTMLEAKDYDEHSIVEFQAWNPENAVKLFVSISYSSYTSFEISAPYHPSSRMRLLLAMYAEFPHKMLTHLMTRLLQ